MIKKTATLLLLLFLSASFSTQALDLFKAEYAVYKDGKLIGDSSIELSMDSPFYTITDKTKGTHGMASFLGFKRSEVTLFTENNGQLLPESYSMKQKVAFNKRKSNYLVDQENSKAYGKHKGDQWELPTPMHFLTPNLATLKLFNDVCTNPKSDLSYQVLRKGKIQNFQFKITSQEDNIIEIDKIHSKPSRITKMWLDTKQQCLPVRTYHIEEDEDVLETKLVQLKIKIDTL